MKGLTGNGEKADVQFLFLLSRPLLVQFGLVNEDLDPMDMYDKDKGGFNLSEWTKFFKDLLKALQPYVVNINLDVTIPLKVILLSVMYSAAPPEGLDEIIKTFNKILERDVKAAIESGNNNSPVSINYLGGGKRYTRRKIRKQKGGATPSRKKLLQNRRGRAEWIEAQNTQYLRNEMLQALTKTASKQQEVVHGLADRIHDEIGDNPIVKARRNEYEARRSPCGRSACKVGHSLFIVLMYIAILSAAGYITWNYDTLQIAAQQQAISARSGASATWGTSISDTGVYILSAIPSLALNVISRVAADNVGRPLYVVAFSVISILGIYYAGKSIINMSTKVLKIHRVAVKVDRMLKDDIETFASMLAGIIEYSATEGSKAAITGVDRLIQGALPINNSLNRIKSLKRAIRTNNIQRQLNEISKSGTRSVYTHFSTKSNSGRVKEGIEHVLLEVFKTIQAKVNLLLRKKGDLTSIKATLEGIYNDEHVQNTIKNLEEVYERINKMRNNENQLHSASDEYLKDFDERGQELIKYATGMITATGRIVGSVGAAGAAVYAGQPLLAAGIIKTGAPEIAGMLTNQEQRAQKVEEVKNRQEAIEAGIKKAENNAKIARLEAQLAALTPATAKETANQP
jgi:hypothetical protein